MTVDSVPLLTDVYCVMASTLNRFIFWNECESFGEIA